MSSGTRCPSCSSASVRLSIPESPELLSFKCDSCGRTWSEYADHAHSTLDDLMAPQRPRSERNAASKAICSSSQGADRRPPDTWRITDSRTWKVLQALDATPCIRPRLSGCSDEQIAVALAVLSEEDFVEDYVLTPDGRAFLQKLSDS